MNTSSAPSSDQQNIQLKRPGKSARTLARSKITDLGLVFTMKHCTILLALAAILISGTLRAQTGDGPQVGDGLWTPSGANIYRGTGNVGIGTSDPTLRLAIIGGPGWTSNGWGGSLQLDNGYAIGWPANTAGQRFGMGHTNGGFYMFRTASDPGTTGTPALYDFVINDTGNVGIGTSNPATKLEVNTASGSYGFTHTAGSIKLGTYVGTSGSGATGGWLGTLSDDSLHFFVHGGQPSLTVSRAGKVAIGTTDPDSQTGLTIRTSSGLAASKYGLEQTDGKVRLSTYVEDDSYGGIGTRSKHPFSLFVNDGTPSLTVSTTGNVGIGTDTPGSKFEVHTGTGVYGFMHSDGNIKVASYVGGSSSGAAGGWLGTNSNHPLHLFVNGGQPALTVNTNNTVSVKVLTITGGADVAEPFPMKEEKLEKGSVVVIDAEHPGRLKRSTQAYDRRVAGIVSGANGINPGIALHQEGAMEGDQNIALSGRVYVEADASNGAIQPGDMLTTSDTPGHAMKGTDHEKVQGAVIGKAMSALPQGSGMVLVLVTLQ